MTPPPGTAGPPGSSIPAMADMEHLGLLDDEAIVLDAGALELAALDHPDLDLQPYLAVLAAIAERVIELGEAAITAPERAAVLAAVIGGEFGFTGDANTYDDPDNADLIRVIDRRRGLPVSLAILYVATARRLGWPADPLGTPGHVLVRIGSDLDPLLIDPFAGGRVIDADTLRALLAQMLGRGAAPSSDHLTAMTNRATLVRLLINQATRAEGRGDLARALTLFTRMTGFSPSSGHAWWERARLSATTGDIPQARASLSAMLEVTRDPQQRVHIFAALDVLTRDAG